jgi:hypothetical protein
MRGDDRHMMEAAPATLLDPYVAFAQHVCARVQDRAEYRQHTADALAVLLTHAREEVLMRFVRFLRTLAKSIKAHHRQFSVEVAVTLLQRRAIALALAPGTACFLLDKVLRD